MNAVLQTFNQEQIQRLTAGRTIPDFRPGDTLRVHVKFREGNKERTQAFEGVCITRRGGKTLQASFSLWRMTMGVGVERGFWLYSPNISIEVVRQGQVRRAKLYYLKHLTGKKARIKERTTFHHAH